MNATQPEFVTVTVAGVTVERMKLMTSNRNGFCRYSNRKFVAGTKIAYKYRESLTDAQKRAIYGDGQQFDLTFIWPLGTPAAQTLTAVPARVAKSWDWPLSEYQEKIWTKLTTTTSHIFIEALAGCAKTSSLIRFSKDLGKLGLTRGKDCWYLAFNASIRKEVYPDLSGTGVRASTTHSFLLNKVLKRQFPDLDTENCINEYLADDNFYRVGCNRLGVSYTDEGRREVNRDSYGRMHQGVTELVGLVKSWAVLPTFVDGRWTFSDEQRSRVLDLIEEYRIVVESPWTEDDYADTALQVVAMGIPKPGEIVSEIDFDDMLYLPLALGLPFPKVDLVMTDESQDFNACQIMALYLLIQNGARVIVVGDEFQALYRFRGADCRAFRNILEMLKTTTRGVEVCELPLNYRCDEAIITHAQQWVPNIRGKSTEKGVVQDVYLAATVQDMIKIDGKSWAVLGRTNAPNVTAAFYTMTEILKTCAPGDRKQVAILGRNAALGPLRAIIFDLCGRDPVCGIADKREGERLIEKGFMTRLSEYRATQTAKLGGNPKYALRLEEIINNCQCLEIVATTVTDDNVRTILKQLESLFVEEVADPARTIVFSSVHRSKGLEWDSVRIIRPDLLPHPLAMPNEDGSWSDEQQQEENACYVAATRARHDLGYVRDWPFDQSGKKLDLVSVNNNPAALAQKPAMDPFASVPDKGMVWTPPTVRPTGPARRAIDIQGPPPGVDLDAEHEVLDLEREIAESEGRSEERFLNNLEERRRVQAPTPPPPVRPVQPPAPPVAPGQFVDDGEPF